MSYEHIQYEERGGIAIATINRPEKRNALAVQTYQELASVVDTVADTDRLRVLVITGTGQGFSSGADVDEVLAMEETVEAAIGRFRKSHGFISHLRTLDKPIIAAINGDAVGAGCSVAIACDLRFMAESARIGLTFARVGLGPDMGASYFLPRLVGLAKANELAFTGELLTAAEAERIGLVNRVVADDQVLTATLEYAEKVAHGPRLAIAIAKRSLERGLSLDLQGVLDGEVASQGLMLNSKDGREGLKSFREKRRPKFD